MIIRLIIFNSLLTFFHSSFGQESSKSRNQFIYGFAGLNCSPVERLGYTLGFTLGCNNHNLQFQNLKNSEFVLFKDLPLNSIVATNEYAILYGYSFQNLIIKFIPAIGVCIGKEKFRTDIVDILPYWGSSWFAPNTRVYHYIDSKFIGFKTSLEFIFKTKIIGIGVQPYLTIYNRIDKGVNFSFKFGKLD